MVTVAQITIRASNRSSQGTTAFIDGFLLAKRIVRIPMDHSMEGKLVAELY
jgi:hypothetical protein